MDLARAVGTSSSVVSQTCTGQRPPPLARIDVWAQVLQLTPAASAAFLAAAELAHAPETVRRRVERLEQRLQEADGTGWDGFGPETAARKDDASKDGIRALLPALTECHARARMPSADPALVDTAWEVHGLVEVLLLRLVGDASLRSEAARKIRRHLERAAMACRDARPTRPASLRAALRQVSRELAQACGLLEP